jgi:hypothetical protein
MKKVSGLFSRFREKSPDTFFNPTIQGDRVIRQRRWIAAILLAFVPLSTASSQLVAPPQTESDGPSLYVVTVQGKNGFIDRDGKVVIEPTFEKAYPFSDGLAAVQQNDMWGFIDTTGRMVIEPKFAMVGLFSDGLASFRAKRLTDPWGYIDKSGEVVIKPQFDIADGFKKGIARVGFETPGSKLLSFADAGGTYDYRFISREGKYVPEPSPTHDATGEPDELIPFRKDDMAGFLNAKGEVVIEPKFQSASPFYDGLACVCQGGLFGYINKRGAWVIPPSFQYANDFSSGLAGVSLGEKGWGFIDLTGKVAIPGRFGWVYQGFRDGIVEVAFEGKSGYINTKGEWVWEPSQ